MSISWKQFTQPNFKVQFYLKSILGLDDNEKYSYEEALEFPMLIDSDMYFIDSIDEDYLYDLDDLDCSGLLKDEFEKIPEDIEFSIPFNDSTATDEDEINTLNNMSE